MSASSPLPDDPVAELGGFPAANPLLAANTQAQRGAQRKRNLLLGACAAGALLIACIVWLCLPKGAPPAAAVTQRTPDPDPPITAPPVKPLLRPAAGEVAAAVGLDKSLDFLLQAAAKVADVETPMEGTVRAHWEIRFPSGSTLETYAKELDSLQVELGVVGGSDTITYVSKFAHKKPERREAPAILEQRIYMTWRTGPMRELDATLVSQAGATVGEAVVAQFYPPESEQALADLEQQFAGKHSLAEIRRTVFGIVPVDDGYKFRVVEQEYISGEVKVLDEKATKDNKDKPKKEIKPGPAVKENKAAALGPPPGALVSLLTLSGLS